MPSPLFSHGLIPWTLLAAGGLVLLPAQIAQAHPDHHQPTQQGDLHGQSSDQPPHHH